MFGESSATPSLVCLLVHMHPKPCKSDKSGSTVHILNYHRTMSVPTYRILPNRGHCLLSSEQNDIKIFTSDKQGWLFTLISTGIGRSRAKKNLNIAPYNINSMTNNIKLEDLKSLARKMNLDGNFCWS